MSLKIRFLLLSCGFLGALFSPNDQAAVANQNAPSTEAYERTLDLLFPGTPADLPDAHVEFALRFEPSNAAESEVVILSTRGAFHAIQYTVTKGNVWATLIEQRDRNGKIDESSAAKAIEVHRKHVRITLQHHKELLSEFFGSLYETAVQMRDANQDNDATVVLDGATYRLTYSGYPADISLVFQDVNPNSAQKSRFKIINWMNQIHEEVSKNQETPVVSASNVLVIST
jgi:hypothetical protein